MNQIDPDRVDKKIQNIFQSDHFQFVFLFQLFCWIGGETPNFNIKKL